MTIEAEPLRSSKRVLDPSERIAEILFGLIMVLTFTGAISVAESSEAEVRMLLIGALGCNIAWGIIDALFYLMGSFAEKGHGLKVYRAVRDSKDRSEAELMVKEALPSVVASVLEPAEVDAIIQRLKDLPEPPDRAHLSKDDWIGSLGVFLLVFLATFPVVIPFLFVENIAAALRISDLIAIVMLFGLGFAYGNYVGRHPWITAFFMLILGCVIVAMTIALGG